MQPRALRTKRKILDTAIRVFARKGFEGARIDELAAAAQANRQRIYAYFGNKEKLFNAAMLEVFVKASYEDEKLLELSEKDISNLTEILLRHYMNIHRLHPAFHRMLGWANLQLKNPPILIKGVKEKSFVHLRNLYRIGQDQGIFSKQVTFEVYIFSLMAITYFHAANSTTASQSISPKLFEGEGAEQIVTQVTTMLCRSADKDK